MQVTIQYETQLKRAVGRDSETLDVEEGTNVAQIVRGAAERHGGTAQNLLVDANGNLRPSVLVFSGERQVAGDEILTQADGETLTLMSPISGG